MRHVKIIVSGKVQKVGFRYSTLKKASEQNIKGYVKNIGNSSVYIEAEGDEHNLDLFVEWCKEGPEWSKVNKFELTEGLFVGYTEFRIITE